MTEPTSSPDDATVVPTGPDGTRTLVVADFADEPSALSAYEALMGAADAGRVDIEGAAVVTKAADGSLAVHETTDRSTRRGVTWGAIGGAVVGVLFPPTILGSAVVAGVIGAALGKGVKAARKHQLADELHYSIDPGHSGVVALVTDPNALEGAAALAAATRVVRRAVQDADVASIRTAAAQAQSEAQT